MPEKVAQCLAAGQRCSVVRSQGKFSRKEAIEDEQLCEAIEAAEQGNIDADYGGGVIKQRIARQGEGKSGGYRAVILYRQGDKAFFVYGYSKSDRSNIDRAEEAAFKKTGKGDTGLHGRGAEAADESGAYQEVHCNVQEQGLS